MKYSWIRAVRSAWGCHDWLLVSRRVEKHLKLRVYQIFGYVRDECT